MYDIGFFDEELELISDPELKAITVAALEAAPKWFWTTPASKTGDHHPIDDRDEGGNCQHTAKVSWLAYKFFDCFELDPDVGLIAGLLHDIKKFSGIDYEEYKRHGQEAAGWLRQLPGTVDLSDAAKVKWNTICFCIESHMGRWGDIPPDTLEQKLIHIADVAASMKQFVALKFYDPKKAEKLEPAGDKWRYFQESDDGKQLIVKFGKYKGNPIEVMLFDVKYTDWVLSSKFPDEVKDIIRQYMVADNNGTQPELPVTK